MEGTRKITIEPVSRIEGHGKITINLDAGGEVEKTRFHVTQIRGFERFCQGRPFEEMPVITQRICGICPVSHQLASAKACDEILGVRIPETAFLLRELIHMGQFIQSHALHFFHLASPDLLLGWDEDPAVRNVIGIAGKFPELATKGILLRKFGQEIIKALGGKKIHPVFAVPGGVSNSLSAEKGSEILSGFQHAYETCQIALDTITQWVEMNVGEAEAFANFRSNYAGLVDEKGCLSLYDGRMRIVDPDRNKLAEFEPSDYLSYIGEHVESWSYLKFPFYKAAGFPDGAYRVGPLGRLNTIDAIATPKANQAFASFKTLIDEKNIRGASLLYHYARMVELLYCLEKAEEILKNEAVYGRDIRRTVVPVHETGVGVIEAPRGTLIHHYEVDRYGALKKVNLIVATGHNNVAMNQAVELVAKEYIRNGDVREGILNRIEGAIRCYDPCLSCSTHAMGQMPLHVQVFSKDGVLIHELCKE